MSTTILVSFVVLCALGTFTLLTRELWLRHKAEVEWLEIQIEEDRLAGVLGDDYSGLVRMDVPRDKPLLHTRSTKVLR